MPAQNQTPRVLEDHVRHVSSLPGSPTPDSAPGPNKEEVKNSVTSSQFVGSQYRAPSDAENIIRQTTGMGKKHEISEVKKAGGEDQDVDRGDNDDEIWMYEDTVQEEFDEE